ncbi:MAG TPA: DUF929 family protein [Acidimicrobiales bacterium]|nr:DUF929 family protein [Acidimicrobiales bacterium]
MAIVVVAVTSGGSKATATTPAPADVVQAATNVPPGTLAAVGVGPSGIQAPKPTTGNQPALTSNGLPEVLYIGAEYCPYCAAERWLMVVALSRFGTFSHLGATESATNDVFPGTKTFSFHGSSYSSPYLVFTSVETQSNQPSGNGFAPLQQPTAAQQKLLQQYDTPPYSQSSGGIPFVDFGNRYIVSGASYSPQVLQGQSMSAIAGSLADPSNQTAQNIDGTANILTAAICQLTNNQPGQVCSTPTITAAKAKLGG